jgi:putative hydrolase of HD superfamily
MAEIKTLIDFVRFTHLIRNVRRQIILEGGVQENDAEHGYQLALVAWFIVEKDNLPLDKYKTACIAMVHDIAEVYAGDMLAFASKDDLSAQSKREAAAIQQLANEWPQFKGLHQLIEDYETLASEEAKFVYALDKLVPIINNYLYEGGAWKNHGISFEKMKSIKVGKIDKNAVVSKYYEELLGILEKHPELFGKGANV